jgi:FAD/FMN-containing dehydrogenase
MNPAWRDSVMDLIPWHPYAENSTREEILESARQMTDVKMRALSSLAPESGAYFNECDTHQPDWQRAFWGDNYDRLLKIKRRIDPDDVFWCRNCVGNDRWTPQVDGGLCLDEEETA